jgi:hypothetical protein
LNRKLPEHRGRRAGRSSIARLREQPRYVLSLSPIQVRDRRLSASRARRSKTGEELVQSGLTVDGMARSGASYLEVIGEGRVSSSNTFSKR